MDALHALAKRIPAEQLRLSVAPMMDWTEIDIFWLVYR